MGGRLILGILLLGDGEGSIFGAEGIEYDNLVIGNNGLIKLELLQPIYIYICKFRDQKYLFDF